MKPLKAYNVKIYQYCSLSSSECGDKKSRLNLPNGDWIRPPNHGTSWIASYEGTHFSDEDGKLKFTLEKDQHQNVGFTGIEVQQSCVQKEGSDQIEVPMFIKKPIKVGATYRYPYSWDPYNDQLYLHAITFPNIHKLVDKGLGLFHKPSQFEPEVDRRNWFQVNLGRKVLIREVGIYEFLMLNRPADSLCLLCDWKRSGSMESFRKGRKSR